jgi:hypothetical protein
MSSIASFLPSILPHPTCYSHHHYSLPLTVRVLTSLHFQSMSIQFHSIYLPNTCLAILSTASFHTLSSCCPVATPCRSSQILASDYQVCLKPRLDDTAPIADVTQSIAMAVRQRKKSPQNVHRCWLPRRYTRSRNLGATANSRSQESDISEFNIEEPLVYRAFVLCFSVEACNGHYRLPDCSELVRQTST